MAGVRAAFTSILTEDYALARTYADRSQTIPQRPFHSYKDTWAYFGLTLAACGQGDIETIYAATDWITTQALLEKYQVKYVYIGQLERTTYLVNEEKFQQNLKPVFSQGLVIIYAAP